MVDCENCSYFFDCEKIEPYNELSYPNECSEFDLQEDNTI